METLYEIVMSWTSAWHTYVWLIVPSLILVVAIGACILLSKRRPPAAASKVKWTAGGLIVALVVLNISATLIFYASNDGGPNSPTPCGDVAGDIALDC